MSLTKAFGKYFSSSAFLVIDDEIRVCGKYGEIAELGDGWWDVWIVKPEMPGGHLRPPIATQKLNALEPKIRMLIDKYDKEAIYRRLDREAYLQSKSETLVREVGFLLGIRKRRTYSEETLKRLRTVALRNIGQEAP